MNHTYSNRKKTYKYIFYCIKVHGFLILKTKYCNYNSVYRSFANLMFSFVRFCDDLVGFIDMITP